MYDGVQLLDCPGYVVGGCFNNCATANDGVCGDGSFGSVSSVCDFGTDCSDCGEREWAWETVLPAVKVVASLQPSELPTIYECEWLAGGCEGYSDYGLTYSDSNSEFTGTLAECLAWVRENHPDAIGAERTVVHPDYSWTSNDCRAVEEEGSLQCYMEEYAQCCYLREGRAHHLVLSLISN